VTTIDDKATELEELFRNQALAAQALRTYHGGNLGTGACLYCGDDELPHPESRYCCDECRKDHERALKVRRIAGRG